ncbi:MAG: hypothetical protein UY71_C0031G0004 [Parcubacteria group bacterium GW2011_GWB1_52_7]|nr:MAG: hypothetical protein UY64_C0016G0005 [Parcubacteria group bacterium GW2011_GWA1_51_12]KKW28155.1 MAG: hypothetical protein UY71_C0031G0004 [Parcubacteria group bacterium GW2011_GWB1_52_7]KKW31340.1 MAG: hypothetical protein UY75_C0009G0008 [Parcubacteria group bacterium GW2011_GWC2_52_8c]
MPEGLISAQQRSSISINKAVGNGLLIVSIIVCLGSIVLSGGVYAYHKILQKQTADLKAEVEKLELDLRDPQGPNNTNIDQILELDRRLASLRRLLEGHAFSSNALSMLEGNTLSRVRYMSFAFGADSRKIDLSGETISYAALAEQIRTLESVSEVERVDFSGLSLSENGGLKFKLGITFKPTLLRWRESK